MKKPEEAYVYTEELDGLVFMSATDDHFYFKTDGDTYNESLWISDPAGKIAVQEEVYFGEIATDSCKEMSITISNVGREELYLSNVEVSGEYYYVGNDFSRIIPASGSVSGTISFFPGSGGDFEGNFHIWSSDPSSGFVTTKLIGSSTNTSGDTLSCFDQLSPLQKSLNLSSSDTLPINLSNHRIDENSPMGSPVGKLTFNESETVEYTLLDGEGHAHNELFQIQNDQLLTNAVFNYESQTTYAIHVRASDGSTSDTTILIISVNDLFEEEASTNECEKEFKHSARPLHDVAILNNGRVVAVGVGDILVSDDKGMTWTDLSLPLISQYDKLDFFAEVGYAMGPNGLVKTTDSGENWRILSLGMDDQWMLGSSFVNDTVGYFINDQRKLYKTQDGGDSWERVGKVPVEEVTDMEFRSDSIGYQGTQQGILYRTSDGGGSWSEMSRVGVESVGSITSIGLLDDAIYYNSRESAYISTNDGGSWSLLVSSDYYNGITALEMRSHTEGYIYKSGTGLFQTTDAGANWDLVYSAEGEIEAIDMKDGLIIGVGKSEDTYGSDYPFKMIIRGESSSFETISYVNTRYFSGFSGPNKVSTDRGLIMLVYGEGSISLSSDYGLTFKNATLNAPYFRDVVFYDKLNGLANTSLGSFKTT
ncbi:MAG: YCF48-related protein, partial [Marinoscillum sp.]